MSTIDKFTLAETDIVAFQPSHEQSPEDIFNFDTKNIDKFTHKEKSILLSDIGKTNSTKLLIPNDTKTNNIRTHAMQNIIFNKLYDESQILCNVSFNGGIANDVRHESFVEINYKVNSKQETHDQAGKPNKSQLFEENNFQINITECNADEIAQEMKLQKFDRLKLSGDSYQLLAGRDLLNFSQQIATGMVRMNSNFKATVTRTGICI